MAEKNHIDYSDLDISYENLNQYNENHTPIEIMCYTVDSSTGKHSLAVYKSIDDELGCEDGPYSFTMHSLTADRLSTLTKAEKVRRAILHVRDKQGKVLEYRGIANYKFKKVT